MQPERLHREFQVPNAPSSMTRWIPISSPPHRHWVSSGHHSFRPELSANQIHDLLRRLAASSETTRFYLEADPASEQLTYRIDAQIQDCLAGDLSVAERLKGRSIFLVQEVRRPDGFDLFDPTEVLDWLGATVEVQPEQEGVLLRLPEFCYGPIQMEAPLPWHPGLIDEAFLPLLFHETYASAEARLLFGRRLMQQLGRHYLDTVWRWCQVEGLKLVLDYPGMAYGLPIDLTLFEHSDASHVCLSDLQDMARLEALLVGCATAQRQSREVFFRPAGVVPTPGWHPTVGLDLPLGPTVPESWSRLFQLAALGLPAPRIALLYPTESFYLSPPPGFVASLQRSLLTWDRHLRDLGHEPQQLDPFAFLEHCADVQSMPARIGLMEFSTLVVMPALTLNTPLIEALKAFVTAGGKLIFLHPAPYLTDGHVPDRTYLLESLLSRRSVQVEEGDDPPDELTLDRIEPDPLRLYERPQNEVAYRIWRRERRLGSMRWWFLWNATTAPRELLGEVRGEWHCERWNLHTGVRDPLKHWHANGYTYFELNLAAEHLAVLFVW